MKYNKISTNMRISFNAEKPFGGIVLELCGNRNVNKISAAASSKIEVKYAQNSVTDTLITLGSYMPDEDGKVEINLDQPIAVSHIFLYCDSQISDITISEYKGVNLLNLYPKCIDIPLKENYYLDTVSVFTGTDGFSHYSLYVSLNGRDFDLVALKNDNRPCGENGDIYNLGGKEARVIRVYYEYNSSSPESAFNNLDFTGRPSGNPITERPEINICDFKSSEFNVPITAADTVKEVYGIVERRLGEKYKSWFDFSLAEKKIYDYYKISSEDGKIKIVGNTGVSIAAGLNYYLKYYCKVCISQVGDQVKMPQKLVMLENDIYRETKAKVRYAYNYCTLSYTSAFWGEKEWRNELDWLALNGVNVVLDITAQEEVWRRFLGGIGYGLDEIKAFIPDPAHYAWFYMANMFGLNGPVHDSWFEERTRLARRNQLIMRRLGMQPVLQGYSGMVPVDIQKYDPAAEIIPQGTWCAVQRPAMLKTDSRSFKKYAELFYNAQREVLGDAIYYATDPFHEGGVTGGMSPKKISAVVLSEMLRANERSVWIIQSWQSNPTSELLAGISDVENGKEHALILDLYAEKSPNYNDGKPGNPNHGYSSEFDGTPWVYCMLNNFGGRLGLHGHLDNMVTGIPKVLNECSHFCGIGMTCEASENNPVLYDFLFESVWQLSAEDSAVPVNIENWIEQYAERRYGRKSNSANRAWKILLNTVYKAEKNMLGQGAPECIVNARPGFGLKSASTWGNSLIGYNSELLERAEMLLSEDYDLLSDSDGYNYDLVSVRQQVLSNKALDCYNNISKAYEEKNISDFKKFSKDFLNLADEMNAVTGKNKYYSFKRYSEFVKALADGKDDFTKRVYGMSAKMLITTFGAYIMSESGLHDYSNRQWSGLIRDFYKPRWEMFFEKCLKELSGIPAKEINWFEWEWDKVRNTPLQ